MDGQRFDSLVMYHVLFFLLFRQGRVSSLPHLCHLLLISALFRCWRLRIKTTTKKLFLLQKNKCTERSPTIILKTPVLKENYTNVRRIIHLVTSCMASVVLFWDFRVLFLFLTADSFHLNKINKRVNNFYFLLYHYVSVAQEAPAAKHFF